MKGHWLHAAAIMAWAAFMGGLSSCSSSPVGLVQGIDDNHGYSSALVTRLVDHEKDDWNPTGLWRRVHAAPPTYVSAGTPPALALMAANGTCFVDAANCWRFFVPKGGVPGRPEGILLGEARKITKTEPAGNLRRNSLRWTLGVILMPLVAAPMGG